MTKRNLGLAAIALTSLGCAWGTAAHAQTLTADRAVEIALQSSPQVIGARAGVYDARSGLYGAYTGVLPRVSASISRGGQWANDRVGTQQFGTQTFDASAEESESYSTVPQLTGSWTVLDLSAWSGLSSARNGLRAARYREQATRSDVALLARQQFYAVVRAIQLAQVNAEALRLSRDDERRVRALFEVGSVSRSDVLSAQVRTAQSELDSLTAAHQITVQRNNLAEVLGVSANQLGALDTTLSAESASYDEAQVFAEAERARPDLLAAEAEVRSANAAIGAARWRRLPYVTVSGGAQFNTKTSSVTDEVNSANSETDRVLSGQVALNLDLFDGMGMEAQGARARASALRAIENRDGLRRNLEGEVREAILGHAEAMEAVQVARRAVESATENLNLTQQKYNVGSATILELIDAQVQLQRARSNYVSALAALRVAEAQIERVRGR